MKQARLGIHTLVTDGDDYDHAWISYETPEGITTYGLWKSVNAKGQRDHLISLGVEGIPPINPDTSVQIGLETLMRPTKSAYFDLTTEDQQKKFDEFIKTPRTFNWIEYNCSDLANGCLEEVVGKKLDIKREYKSKGAKSSVIVVLSHADQLQNYLDVIGPERPPRLVDPDKVKQIAEKPDSAIQERVVPCM